MDSEVIFPVLAGDLQERLWLRNSGIVVEHVDPTQLAHRSRDEALHLIVVPHVGAAEENAAPQLFDFVGCCLRGFLVDVSESNIGTLARKAERNLLADSASCSAHQYDNR